MGNDPCHCHEDQARIQNQIAPARDHIVAPVRDHSVVVFGMSQTPNMCKPLPYLSRQPCAILSQQMLWGGA